VLLTDSIKAEPDTRLPGRIAYSARKSQPIIDHDAAYAQLAPDTSVKELGPVMADCKL
jgi:hypothetical protein